MTDTNKEYYWGKSKKYRKEWNNLVKRASRHNAVEYYKKHKESEGYEIILEGEPTTIEEKLVECFYSRTPNYIYISDFFDGDYIRFEDMQRYADDMKYFILDLLDTI